LKLEFSRLRILDYRVRFCELLRWGLVVVVCFWFEVAASQSITKDYLLGRFNPEADNRFEKIPAEYSSGSANGGYLRKEVLQAFAKMRQAAKNDGVTLTIVSATRNFQRQKSIWESKWTGKTLVEGQDVSRINDSAARAKIILRFSAMPGTSRHHWGTDMDLNDLEDAYFQTPEGKKVYAWLIANAPKFGFCQPYTSKLNFSRTGYEEEKWHWSYLPLSSELLKQYVQSVDTNDLNGFMGSATAEAIEVIKRYVGGVSCK
jgi:LAS superfamily LD-carboxypeptidase LdcB